MGPEEVQTFMENSSLDRVNAIVEFSNYKACHKAKALVAAREDSKAHLESYVTSFSDPVEVFMVLIA